MGLYISLMVWMIVVTVLGIRPDAKSVADNWPQKSESVIARRNLRIVNSLFVVSMVFLWVLTAFRSASIGNDTQTYIYYFKIFGTNGINKARTFELGYQYLNVLIGKITDDPHIFLIIVASIMYLAVAIYIYRYSKNILISLCLFYCVAFSIFTSVLRQGMAMVIALYAYQLLKDNKKIKSALLFAVACLFHTSAIVCFLLFINLKLWRKKWLVFGLTTLFTVLSISGTFNSIVIAIIPRYAHYFESRYASTGWLAVSYSLLRNYLFYWLASKAADEGKRSDQLAVTNMTLLLIFSAFGYSVNLFTRAGEFFLLIAITELPNILYSEKITKRNWWMIGICLTMLGMFLLELIFRPGWNHLYPYEFWH